MTGQARRKLNDHPVRRVRHAVWYLHPGGGRRRRWFDYYGPKRSRPAPFNDRRSQEKNSEILRVITSGFFPPLPPKSSARRVLVVARYAGKTGAARFAANATTQCNKASPRSALQLRDRPWCLFYTRRYDRGRYRAVDFSRIDGYRNDRTSATTINLRLYPAVYLQVFHRSIVIDNVSVN